MKISVNCMIRDENFAPYAILAVAPHVDEVLVYDTGSGAEYLRDLDEVAKLASNVKVTRKNLENAHGWTHKTADESAAKEIGRQLGDIRREMRRESVGDWIYTVDGDEIAPDLLANKVTGFARKNLNEKDALFLPFVDLVHKLPSNGQCSYVRQIHTMGRIFRKSCVKLKGSYPSEMDYRISPDGDYCIEPNSPCSIILRYDSDSNSVIHMEALQKPWRKPLNVLREFHGKLPEVFERYPQFRKNIERWL